MSVFQGEYPGRAKWRGEVSGIASWITLNIADLAVTIVSIVTMGGGFIEGNPIAAWIGDNFAGLAVYKIALTFLVIMILACTRKLHLLKWVNIVIAAVVGWNLALLSIF